MNDQHSAHGLVQWHGTTIIGVKKNGCTVIAGDGQVSMGNTVMKPNARKVRRIGEGKVIAGFAGATADAFTLFERLERKLEQIEDTTSDPVECLRQGMRAYIEFGLKNPNHYKVAFMTELKQEQLAGGRAKAMGQQTLDHTRKSLLACAERGLIATGDVEVLAQSLWATIHGLASLLIVKRTFPWTDAERLIDVQVETFLQGMLVAKPVSASA